MVIVISTLKNDCNEKESKQTSTRTHEHVKQTSTKACVHANHASTQARRQAKHSSTETMRACKHISTPNMLVGETLKQESRQTCQARNLAVSQN